VSGFQAALPFLKKRCEIIFNNSGFPFLDRLIDRPYYEWLITSFHVFYVWKTERDLEAAESRQMTGAMVR
jgi:hypothetical protein